METYRQFLLHCLAFARLRIKQLGSLIFGKPLHKAETDIAHLKKSVIGTKRLSICKGLIIYYMYNIQKFQVIQWTGVQSRSSEIPVNVGFLT